VSKVLERIQHVKRLALLVSEENSPVMMNIRTKHNVLRAFQFINLADLIVTV